MYRYVLLALLGRLLQVWRRSSWFRVSKHLELFKVTTSEYETLSSPPLSFSDNVRVCGWVYEAEKIIRSTVVVRLDDVFVTFNICVCV